ncbi:hypothetical protein BDW71DRAFT_190887 [Aspergillus fruticulosus]
MHALAHPDGEVATSKAAASGILMGLSCYLTMNFKNVIAHAQGKTLCYAVQSAQEQRGHDPDDQGSIRHGFKLQCTDGWLGSLLSLLLVLSWPYTGFGLESLPGSLLAVG